MQNSDFAAMLKRPSGSLKRPADAEPAADEAEEPAADEPEPEAEDAPAVPSPEKVAAVLGDVLAWRATRADAGRVRTSVALRQDAEDFRALLPERNQIIPRRVAESSKDFQRREGPSLSVVRAGVLQGHPNLAPRAAR